jgi:phage/plasmid-like protein (TIGR03299 family)
MSDDIEIMANGSAAFVYGKVPGWHSLGAVAKPGATCAELREQAGHFPVGEHKCFTADGSVIDGYKHLVRTDGKDLGIVAESYKVHQAETLWDLYVEPYMRDGRLSLDAAGNLAGGRKIWVCGKIESLAVDVTGKGDIVLPYLSFASSYDGSLKTEVMFHDQRIVCANTLAMARNSDATKMVSAKHTRHSALKLEQIAASIALETQDFAANTAAYALMARTPLRAAELESYVKAVFTPEKSDNEDSAKRLIKSIEALVKWTDTSYADAGDRLASMVEFPSLTESPRDSILDDILDAATARVMDIVETPNRTGGVSQGARGTVWDVYNAATEYLSHERGRSAETRIEALWFGPAYAQSVRAFDVAFAMAKGAPIPR